MPLLKYALGNYLVCKCWEIFNICQHKSVCGALGVMDHFLLQACVFGNAVQVLWFGKHKEKQSLSAQL